MSILVVATTATGIVGSVLAQDAKVISPPVGPQAKDSLDFAQQSLKLHKLTVLDAASRKGEFVAEPLMKFENPVSQILDGFMFLWTDRGRPAATVKCYYNAPRQSWGRTFVSLSERPLEMQAEGKMLWAPQEPALSFVRLKGAPPPAERPAQRLAQMRAIARRFQVVDHWGLKDPTDWELRLLSTPLYRYEIPKEAVVDGALFGYVLTTSPEALLLLEARKNGDSLHWEYAVSRCTRFQVRFSLDGKPLAEFPRLESWPASGTYFHHPILVPDYPFKRMDKAKPTPDNATR